MSISVNCDVCGKTLKAPDSNAGKKAKCPQCGSIVTIPEPIYDAEEAGGNEPHDDGSAPSDADPFVGIGSFDSQSVSVDDERKPCPMCGEMIVATAAKCRFCNEIFDPKLKRRSKKGGELDADLSAADWIVAIVCYPVGCIVGIVYMIQGKSKGLKTVGVSILIWLIWAAIIASIKAANQNRM